MVRFIVWFAGLVALAGLGAFLWFSGMLDPLLAEVGLGQEGAESQTENSGTPERELATGNDTSNDALEQDLEMLDAHLNAYTASEAEVESSLQDTPVQQEY